jgi:hypothetical protein
MLSKPASCEGCPLQHIGTGFMKPIAPTNGVVLLGEALGEKEESEWPPISRTRWVSPESPPRVGGLQKGGLRHHQHGLVSAT